MLSAPSLVVADNEPAILEVGDQVPISTGSTVTGLNVVSSISRQNTGIILKVLPHVHPNGSIELEIEQEVSNVVNPAGASAQNLTPTISQRRIHSTVATSSGQTALLGGLIKEDDERSVAGLPGLNQIKYLGDLLSQKNDSKTRSEIIVFVTTKIVRNRHDAQVVAEEFRERLDSMRRSPSISARHARQPRRSHASDGDEKAPMAMLSIHACGCSEQRWSARPRSPPS